MKKMHKTIALAIVIAIALGILALLIPTAASASTADDKTTAAIKAPTIQPVILSDSRRILYTDTI